MRQELKEPKWFKIIEDNYYFNVEKKCLEYKNVLKKYEAILLIFYTGLVALLLIAPFKVLISISFMLLCLSPFMIKWFLKRNGDAEWFRGVSTIFYPFVILVSDKSMLEYTKGIDYREEFRIIKKEKFKDLKKHDIEYALNYCNNTKSNKDLQKYKMMKELYFNFSEEKRLEDFNKSILTESKSLDLKLKNKHLNLIRND